MVVGQGRSLNTVSTYMRRIRHIYNLAVEANEAPLYPTCSKMSSRALKASGRRRCREMLERMFNAPLGIRPCGVYSLTVRLMFAFSGIAFVDLTHLKWENIRGWDIAVSPTKSGSLIQLEIPSRALWLLDELSACTAKNPFYLFPF